jgi:leader peptidase (prepilin peptidase)/N-methyltransferase
MNHTQIIFFIIGLIVGSFLNVCIYRIPRSLSIVSPPSACPLCHTTIKPWHNIPLVSYIMLGGKCRNCGGPISLRYPLVELVNGALYWAVVTSFGLGWHVPLICLFVSAMVVITFIDIDFQIIPDAITLPGLIVGLLSASFLFPDPFRTVPGMQYYAVSSQGGEIVGFANSVSGLLTGGGLFYLIAELGRRISKTDALGGGDIKMMAMVGSFMGWKAILLTTFIGSVSGSIAGIFLMVTKGKGSKFKIPFGPFLALGALVTLFYGNILLQWYFR